MRYVPHVHVCLIFASVANDIGLFIVVLATHMQPSGTSNKGLESAPRALIKIKVFFGQGPPWLSGEVGCHRRNSLDFVRNDLRNGNAFDSVLKIDVESVII